MPSIKFDNILSCFPSVSFGIAYGSGVFEQDGYASERCSRQLHLLFFGATISDRNRIYSGTFADFSGPPPMVDMIFAVDDPLAWHEENFRRHRDHYAGAGHLGPKAVSMMQTGFGAGMWYNALVPAPTAAVKRNEHPSSSSSSSSFSSSSSSSPWPRIKYGVISTTDLAADCSSWTSLYAAGRLHKPVRVLRTRPDLDRAVLRNRQAALRAALLLLPPRFTLDELCASVCGLSYAGDWRMLLGEHPDKVMNIVRKNRAAIASVYLGIAQGGGQSEWGSGGDGQGKGLLQGELVDEYRDTDKQGQSEGAEEQEKGGPAALEGEGSPWFAERGFLSRVTGQEVLFQADGPEAGLSLLGGLPQWVQQEVAWRDSESLTEGAVGRAFEPAELLAEAGQAAVTSANVRGGAGRAGSAAVARVGLALGRRGWAEARVARARARRAVARARERRGHEAHGGDGGQHGASHGSAQLAHAPVGTGLGALRARLLGATSRGLVGGLHRLRGSPGQRAVAGSLAAVGAAARHRLAAALRPTLAGAVGRAAAGQTIKGVCSAGVSRSVVYAGEKLGKWWAAVSRGNGALAWMRRGAGAFGVTSAMQEGRQ